MWCITILRQLARYSHGDFLVTVRDITVSWLTVFVTFGITLTAECLPFLLSELLHICPLFKEISVFFSHMVSSNFVLINTTHTEIHSMLQKFKLHSRATENITEWTCSMCTFNSTLMLSRTERERQLFYLMTMSTAKVNSINGGQMKYKYKVVVEF